MLTKCSLDLPYKRTIAFDLNCRLLVMRNESLWNDRRTFVDQIGIGEIATLVLLHPKRFHENIGF